MIDEQIYQECEFPTALMIEVSNYCNHKCVFCSNQFSNRRREFIDIDLCVDVIDKAYLLGAREISFHGMGEPFTNPNLEKYVYTAKKKGYEYIYIDTNGGLASPDRLKNVISAGLDSIKFSVSGADRETYRAVQGKDDFDNVMNNLEWLIEWKKKNNSKIKIIIDFCLMKMNEGQQDILKRRFEKRVDSFWVSECSDQAGEMDNKDISINRIDASYCVEPFYRLVVTANGYADSCCMDNNDGLVFADLLKLKKESCGGNYLIKAWEMGRKTRDSHRSGEAVPNKCLRCEFIKYYEAK